jgi:hypothetical protein
VLERALEVDGEQSEFSIMNDLDEVSLKSLICVSFDELELFNKLEY